MLLRSLAAIGVRLRPLGLSHFCPFDSSGKNGFAPVLFAPDQTHGAGRGNRTPGISLSRILFICSERVRGVEPLSSAWKAEVIPLYDTRRIKFSISNYFVGLLGIEPSLHAPEACVLPAYSTPSSQLGEPSRLKLCLSRCGLRAAPLPKKAALFWEPLLVPPSRIERLSVA